MNRFDAFSDILVLTRLSILSIYVSISDFPGSGLGSAFFNSCSNLCIALETISKLGLLCITLEHFLDPGVFIVDRDPLFLLVTQIHELNTLVDKKLRALQLHLI
jgi:hypothetical protein